MTTSTLETPALDLRARRLPTWVPAAIGVLAFALSYAVIYLGKALGGGFALTVIVTLITFLIGLSVTARIVENARSARNRVATALIYSAFVLAALPLYSVVKTLIVNGHSRLDMQFFTHSDAGHHRVRRGRRRVPRHHRHPPAGRYRGADHGTARYRWCDLHRRVRSGPAS